MRRALFDTLEGWKFSTIRRILFQTLSQTWRLKISTTRRILLHTLSQSWRLKFLTTQRTLFHTLFQTWRLKFSTTQRTFFHKLSQTWRTNFSTLEKTYNALKKSLPHLPLTWKVLQSPCMDYHFLCNLVNSKPFLKRILPFYVIQVKPLITSCSNTMSFLLLGVGP